MRFIDLLRSGSEFDCELITNLWETNYSFVWDTGYDVTQAGYNEFRKILESTCIITRQGNIELLNPQITYEELEDFTMAVAGYCTCEEYDLWFKTP